MTMHKIWFEVNASAFTSGMNLSLEDILDATAEGSQFIYHQPENVVLIAIYIPVFLTALIANSLVIVVFCKHKSFRSISNTFVLNLSVSDLLVTLICMPAALGNLIHRNWLFGPIICKANHYLQGVSVGCSVFTLTAMSIDRYLAIRHPLKRKNCISKKLTMKVILFIWLISLLISCPILYVRRIDGFRFHTHDFVFCVEEWEDDLHQRLFGLLIFVVVYALPGLTIALSYMLMGCRLRHKTLLFADYEGEANGNANSQQKSQVVGGGNNGTKFQVCTVASIHLMQERRRVARTLSILAVAFAACWLPSTVLNLVLDFSKPSSSSSSSESEGSTQGNNDVEYDLTVKLSRYFVVLGHINSLLNPLLYSLLTKNFRKHLRHLLCCGPAKRTEEVFNRNRYNASTVLYTQHQHRKQYNKE